MTYNNPEMDFKKPPHELIEWLPEHGYDDDEAEVDEDILRA